MITIYLAQTFRPSRFRDGAFVPAQGGQFATLGEALVMGRAAVALGHRADVSRVRGDPATDLWDEPVLLKRLWPAPDRPEEDPASADEHDAPNSAVEQAFKRGAQCNREQPEACNDNQAGEHGARSIRLEPSLRDERPDPDTRKRR